MIVNWSESLNLRNSFLDFGGGGGSMRVFHCWQTEVLGEDGTTPTAVPAAGLAGTAMHIPSPFVTERLSLNVHCIAAVDAVVDETMERAPVGSDERNPPPFCSVFALGSYVQS
jgi:hypothetical protein